MRHPPTVDLRPWFSTVDDVASRFSLPIDWTEFFGEDRPVEIDVGCGRGLFLTNASDARPDTNFLGIELDFKEGRRAATRLYKRKQPNARIIGGSVFDVFGKLISPGSVNAIHVYFPDPWWKQKHRRRRVFTDKFVDECSRLLVPGGMLHSWTDVEEYYGVISALMNHHRDFETLPPPDERAAEHDLDYQTSFERKKRQLGLPIYRGQWRRRDMCQSQIEGPSVSASPPSCP
jgi:tRNA (guanine-N7-)-methyltransferase